MSSLQREAWWYAGPVGRRFLAVWVVSKSFRNVREKPNPPTWKNYPHPDVQPGPTTWQTPFTGLSDVSLLGHTINNFGRPAVLKLNIEGFAASKMNVLHHPPVQYQALVILLQKFHCTCANKLTIPGFTLAGSSLSRKHCLATFAYDRLKWTLVGQSPATSETEWLCVDVDGYRFVNVYKPPPT